MLILVLRSHYANRARCTYPTAYGEVDSRTTTGGKASTIANRVKVQPDHFQSAD